MSTNGRRRLEDIQVEEAMSSVRADSCRDLIADIRTGAANEYLRVKRHKQSELNYRCIAEDGTPGVPPSRAQKKKVDNHASAVASRCKQEFLVSEFESLLRRKLSEAQILTAACAQSRATIAEQRRDMRAKDAQIGLLRKELASFRTPSHDALRRRHSNPQTILRSSPVTHAPPQQQVHIPYSRSVCLDAQHFIPAVHSTLSSSKASAIQASKMAESLVVKSEDLHVFAEGHELDQQQEDESAHVHLSLGHNAALENQDLGAAMDEIISPAGHSFEDLSHTLVPADDYSSKHSLSHWDSPSAVRQRILSEEVLKSNLQSDNTSCMLNPVA